MEGLSDLALKLQERHPCTDKFDPEALAELHIRRGGKNQIFINGRWCTWIGNKGSILYAPLGMKVAYNRCADVHGEDGAKIWSWLQGFIVGENTSYIELFKEEIDGAESDKPVHPGSTDTSEDVAGDRADEPSGSNVVTDADELPF